MEVKFKICPVCNEQIAFNSVSCVKCGNRFFSTNKNKTVAGLLAFFCGTLGIHRFYLNRAGSGFVYILVSITIIGLIFTSIFSFIEAIKFFLMSEEDFARRYSTN